MTLLVRDEQDIIAENIEFHKSQGVDFFIVTDNRSIDGTSNILKKYEKAGLLHYIWEGNDDYSQHEWVTRMARMAYRDHHADWVINNDADEFWWPLQGNLKATFQNIQPEFNALIAKRYNFVPLENMHQPFYKDMIYRERISLNPLGRPILPKIAHRGHPNVIVEQGNHKINGIGKIAVENNLIEILHFPIRSYEQFENKIIKGGAAYERNRELPQSTGKGWRKLYDDYKLNQNLYNQYAEYAYDKRRIFNELESKKIVLDNRLSNYFSSNILTIEKLILNRQ